VNKAPVRHEIRICPDTFWVADGGRSLQISSH
jgi:hypothetical protein